MKSNEKNRCILIFPQFENAAIIDNIRRQFDPNYKNIAPHITLVFPFESSISKNELEYHVASVVSGMSCFDLKLHGIKRMDGENFFLMLGVLDGAQILKDLHEKLYTGILAQYRPNWPGGFMPHMTIGQFDSNDELNEAHNNLIHIKEVFSANICKVSVEIIGKKNESIIEFECPLKK
jgi:2'-5' RNA ligase